MIYARPSVYLLSGGAFEDSIFPMRIIMPTLVFIGITNVLGIQILVPMLKEQNVLISAVIGAVVNLAANVALIPNFGASGAAFGTVLAEGAVLVVQYLALRKNVKDLFRQIRYWKILFALLAGVLSSVWTLYAPLSNFMTLAISSILFFGCYGLVLLLTGEPLLCEVIACIRKKLKM